MSEENPTIRIRKVRSAASLRIVESLAWRIFPQTYAEMIPAGQIPYMMHMMYDYDVVRKEFSEGVSFSIIYNGAEPIGYISWHPLACEGKKAIKLEKLYLDFAYHGRGIGQRGLRYVIRAAARAGAAFVLLNVNKENLRAQKAYENAGFYRWRSVKNPIGDGYYMDDYVMRFDLVPPRG